MTCGPYFIYWWPSDRVRGASMETKKSPILCAAGANIGHKRGKFVARIPYPKAIESELFFLLSAESAKWLCHANPPNKVTKCNFLLREAVKKTQKIKGISNWFLNTETIWMIGRSFSNKIWNFAGSHKPNLSRSLFV